MYLTRIQGYEQMIQQNRMGWLEGIPPFYILLESRGLKSKAGPKLVLGSTIGGLARPCFVLFHSLCLADLGGRGCWAGDFLCSRYLLSLSGRGLAPLVWELFHLVAFLEWWGLFISISWMLVGMGSHLSFEESIRIEFLWVSSDSSERLSGASSFVFHYFSNIKFLYILGCFLSIYCDCAD